MNSLSHNSPSNIKLSNSQLAEKLLSERKVIVIGGATASGKTGLSIALSQELPIEIVSADSRQFYKYMDIGTAKPTPEERSIVKHHFIDNLDPREYFSAGKYANEARNTLNALFEAGKIPLVVGGSGLYIQALCEGFFDDGTDDISSEKGSEILAIRKQIECELAEKGIDALYNELMAIDSESAMLYNDKNPRRIARAIEYYRANGIPISQAKKQYKVAEINYKPAYFAIDWQREVLYNRINQRTLQMWEDGLLAETEKLLEMGYERELNSLNTVGYKEVFDFIDGKESKERTIELIAQHTRNYAKRQITWFKRIESLKWVEYDVAAVLSALSE